MHDGAAALAEHFELFVFFGKSMSKELGVVSAEQDVAVIGFRRLDLLYLDWLSGALMSGEEVGTRWQGGQKLIGGPRREVVALS